MIPLVVALFYVPDSIMHTQLRDAVAASAFILAGFTDWLDGWLARRWNQTSSFGAFLDPVADKLMVCAALVVLLSLDRVDSLIAVVIVGREITISALREWMAQLGARANVAVHWLGKDSGSNGCHSLLALPLSVARVALSKGGGRLDCDCRYFDRLVDALLSSTSLARHSRKSDLSAGRRFGLARSRLIFRMN